MTSAAEQTLRGPRRRPGGFSLLEAVGVLLIIGILCGIVSVAYTHIKRSELDTTGFQVLAAAQLDGRRVASQHAMTYPDIADLVTQMANTAGTAGGLAVTYQQDPSTGPTDVAVARPDEATAGYAVLTTTSGSLTGGNASDGHCLMMVDSLRTGTIWASQTGTASGSTSTCVPTLAACPARVAGLTGSGTDADPYILPENFTC